MAVQLLSLRMRSYPTLEDWTRSLVFLYHLLKLKTNTFSANLFTRHKLPASMLALLFGVLAVFPVILNLASHLHSKFPMPLVSCGIQHENL